MSRKGLRRKHSTKRKTIMFLKRTKINCKTRSKFLVFYWLTLIQIFIWRTYTFFWKFFGSSRRFWTQWFVRFWRTKWRSWSAASEYVLVQPRWARKERVSSQSEYLSDHSSSIVDQTFCLTSPCYLKKRWSELVEATSVLDAICSKAPEKSSDPQY